MDALTIALLQQELVWESPEENREAFSKKLDQLQNKPDLVILPEMFTTGFSMEPERLAEPMTGPTLEWMKARAEELDAVLTGSLIIREDGEYFNRLIWMPPDGQCRYYDKRHLFTLAGEDLHYSAGKEQLIVELNGWKILPLICYDLRFPVWSRNTRDYDLLIYIANWPSPRRTHWKALLPARAIENQSYVVGLNRIGKDGNGHPYAGDSMVVDFSGEILYQASGVEDVFVVRLKRELQENFRKRFAFLADRDSFLIQ